MQKAGLSTTENNCTAQGQGLLTVASSSCPESGAFRCVMKWSRAGYGERATMRVGYGEAATARDEVKESS